MIENRDLSVRHSRRFTQNPLIIYPGPEDDMDAINVFTVCGRAENIP